MSDRCRCCRHRGEAPRHPTARLRPRPRPARKSSPGGLLPRAAVALGLEVSGGASGVLPTSWECARGSTTTARAKSNTPQASRQGAENILNALDRGSSVAVRLVDSGMGIANTTLPCIRDSRQRIPRAPERHCKASAPTSNRLSEPTTTDGKSKRLTPRRRRNARSPVWIRASCLPFGSNGSLRRPL